MPTIPHRFAVNSESCKHWLRSAATYGSFPHSFLIHRCIIFRLLCLYHAFLVEVLFVVSSQLSAAYYYHVVRQYHY